MDFFGIGGWELILVGVLAILVFGPERMTRYAFQAGRWMRKFSIIWQDSLSTLREQLNEEIGDTITQEDVDMIRNLRNINIQRHLGLDSLDDELTGRDVAYDAWQTDKPDDPSPSKSAAQPGTNGAESRVYSAWVPPRNPDQ